jgi:hypothetical protein
MFERHVVPPPFMPLHTQQHVLPPPFMPHVLPPPFMPLQTQLLSAAQDPQVLPVEAVEENGGRREGGGDGGRADGGGREGGGGWKEHVRGLINFVGELGRLSFTETKTTCNL